MTLENRNRFHYLIKKIEEAELRSEPFPHILIDDFFTEKDFEEIISVKENRLPEAKSDEELFEYLFEFGYKIVNFPGCITDKKEYLKWHSGKRTTSHKHSACESFGMTLRQTNPKSELFKELKAFIEGIQFNAALGRKFGIEVEKCSIDNGIQKYLDGYEISPHPDIRKKALTFMVNMNPHSNSEKLEHHTKYLKLKPEREYVKSFWAGNKSIDRCWVPWDWCETVFTQAANNSFVTFSPDNHTFHAVKASYNHLVGQRTQLYGNLWYKEMKRIPSIKWEDLDLIKFESRRGIRSKSIKGFIGHFMPPSMKSFVKKLTFSKNNDVMRRDY